MGNFNVQALANTTWAFARANRPVAQLVTALAEVAEMHGGNFNAQGLQSTAHAFEEAGHVDEWLFTKLARVAQQCMGHWNAAQGLENTVHMTSTIHVERKSDSLLQ